MDATRFDALTRRITAGLSRHRSIGHLAPLGLLGFASPNEVEAKKKKCPPCKQRKKGKCKTNLPDGTACPGGICQSEV
jgi:hypothetical protein